MCRAVPRHPVVSCRMAASSLKARLSGPPSSRTWLHRLGSIAAWLTRAATSVADTKLIELSPRPNTTIFPEVWSGRPMIWPQVSMKAVAGTMVQGMPLPRRASSAACLARNSSMGGRGNVPTTDTRTMATPFRAAASIRLALPARSTDAGEMTVPAPRSAWTRRRGRGHHPEPPPRREPASCRARAGSRGSTRTARPWPARRGTSRVPKVPVPPATRITAGSTARARHLTGRVGAGHHSRPPLRPRRWRDAYFEPGRVRTGHGWTTERPFSGSSYPPNDLIGTAFSGG